MGAASITQTDGRDWWLQRTDPSGRQRYPERIRVGTLDAPRVYVPERTCGEWRGDPRHDAIGHAAAHEDDELWCEHCDIELDESWLYCPNCGARVVSE